MIDHAVIGMLMMFVAIGGTLAVVHSIKWAVESYIERRQSRLTKHQDGVWSVESNRVTTTLPPVPVGHTLILNLHDEGPEYRLVKRPEAE